MFAVVKACIGIIIPYRHCARNFLKWLTIDGIYKDINDIKKDNTNSAIVKTAGESNNICEVLNGSLLCYRKKH